jgi:hypothetical protein
VPLPTSCRYTATSDMSVPAIAYKLQLPPAVLLSLNKAASPGPGGGNASRGGGWSYGGALACSSIVLAGGSIAVPCPGPAAQRSAEAAARQNAPGC